MRDFNFFEPFEKKQKRRKGLRISYPLVLILVLLAAAIWPAWNFYQIQQLDREIQHHRDILVNDSRYPLFEVASEKERELEEAQATLLSLEDSAELIFDKEVIDELLLFAIASAMPLDTSLTSMNISNRNVQLSGIADSKPAIAEFEYNIRQTGYFESIFVPSITESGDMWQFSMSFMVKGGAEE